MKKAKHHVGKILVESLTMDQIVLLLDVVFSAGDIDRPGLYYFTTTAWMETCRRC